MLQFYSLDGGSSSSSSSGAQQYYDVCLSASELASQIVVHSLNSNKTTSGGSSSSGNGGKSDVLTPLQLLWSASPFSAEQGVSWGTQNFPVVDTSDADFVQQQQLLLAQQRHNNNDDDVADGAARTAASAAAAGPAPSSSLSGFTLVRTGDEEDGAARGEISPTATTEYLLVQQSGATGDVFAQKLVLHSRRGGSPCKDRGSGSRSRSNSNSSSSSSRVASASATAAARGAKATMADVHTRKTVLVRPKASKKKGARKPAWTSSSDDEDDGSGSGSGSDGSGSDTSKSSSSNSKRMDDRQRGAVQAVVTKATEKEPQPAAQQTGEQLTNNLPPIQLE
jgi:hypothetical protein